MLKDATEAERLISDVENFEWLADYIEWLSKFEPDAEQREDDKRLILTLRELSTGLRAHVKTRLAS